MSHTAANPLTQLETESGFHDRWASTIDANEVVLRAAFTAETTPEFHYALEIMGDLNSKTVLDLGCGPGEAAAHFAELGAHVIAVDISEGMLRLAGEVAKINGARGRTHLCLADAAQLPFSANSIDIVFGSNVLHHVDIESAVPGLSRLLKKDGIGIFIDPLSYNPVINVYRRMSHMVRTRDEKPLSFGQLKPFRKQFGKVEHREFHLFTLLLFLWFYLGERISPNETRYWRKWVLEAEKYARPYRILRSMDRFVLRYLPFLRRWCWNIVITCSQPA